MPTPALSYVPVTAIEHSTILVTGAARGLGRQMALAFGSRGANLVLWDIDAEHLATTVADVARVAPTPPRGYVCDVGDRDMVAATARQVVAEAGQIDILVNNAGVMSGRWLLDCSDRQIERTIAVNSLALFWTCRAFLPGMIAAARGHVVTVASAAGLLGVAGLVDYCASKWAAVGFDEALRMELRRVAPRLRTTVVCPYLIDTDLVLGVRPRFPWLTPSSPPDAVAARIVRAVARNERRVIMPPLMRLLPALHLVPEGLKNWLMNLFGVHRCMDAFVGRSNAPSQGNR